MLRSMGVEIKGSGLKPECEVMKLDCYPQEKGKWFPEESVEYRKIVLRILFCFVFKIEEA